MTSTTCGWCDTVSHMTTHGKAVDITDDPMDAWQQQQAHTCDNCSRIMTATIYNTGDYGTISSAVTYVETQAGTVCLEWSPAPQRQRHYPDVPQHIADAATEATLCLSTGAYRAVGCLARAVIEATAQERDAPGKDLAARINSLAQKTSVGAHARDQAHEIRYFGNDMAHGDFTEPVTREGAAEIIDLMDEVLRAVYQSPARLAKRKAERVAKEAADASKITSNATQETLNSLQ